MQSQKLDLMILVDPTNSKGFNDLYKKNIHTIFCSISLGRAQISNYLIIIIELISSYN